MVFTLNNHQTSNFLECFNTPTNSSRNSNFQKAYSRVSKSIAEDRANTHRGEASARASKCAGGLAGEAHVLECAEQLVNAVVSDGSMAHVMPRSTSASGAGDQRPSATQPKPQQATCGISTGSTPEHTHKDPSELLRQIFQRGSSSPVGTVRGGGDGMTQVRVKKKKEPVADPAAQTASAKAAFSKYRSLETFPGECNNCGGPHHMHLCAELCNRCHSDVPSECRCSRWRRPGCLKQSARVCYLHCPFYQKPGQRGGKAARRALPPQASRLGGSAAPAHCHDCQ
jgi:hypothetical protein